MNCPRCKSSEYSKDGIVNLRQRYKCKKCVYRYTVEKKSDLKSDETKRLALEMYLYYVKKNYGWLWIAVDRFGKRYVDFVCGDRSTQTFKKLWVKIKDLEVNGFCSDYWKSYSELIPSEKHCESKREA